jgi:hypothetical protein
VWALPAAVFRWGPFARTAVFFALASCSIVSLILAFPVYHYYLAVDYEESSFDYEAVGVFTDTRLAALEGIAEDDSFVSFVTLGPAQLAAKGRTTGPAFVYFTDQPARLDASWFRDSQTVAAVSPAPDRWLDISAEAAVALGVGPGDEIEVPADFGTYSARVRRVIATARHGFRLVAVGPIYPDTRAILSKTEFGDAPNAVTFRSRLTPVEIAASGVLPDDGRSLLRTRQQALDEVEPDPLASAPVLVGASVLGLLALAGVGFREGAILMRRRTADLAILSAIGATRRQIAIAVGLVEGLSVCLGLGAAYLATVLFTYRFVFAPALPPAFVPLVVGGMAAAALAFELCVALAVWGRLQTTRLAEELAHAAVH